MTNLHCVSEWKNVKFTTAQLKNNKIRENTLLQCCNLTVRWFHEFFASSFVVRIQNCGNYFSHFLAKFSWKQLFFALYWRVDFTKYFFGEENFLFFCFVELRKRNVIAKILLRNFRESNLFAKDAKELYSLKLIWRKKFANTENL